ncbi:MAG TPA: hypothetical protein VFT99_14090 [Roseiflexaceae bacterium]|nr:hypothetical protein [Roseiflexaceae bacterium]
MSAYARRRQVNPAPVARPASLTVIALLGVLFGMALFAGEIVLGFYRAQLGIGWGSQLLDVAIAGFVAILIIWMFWGVWEMVASAWWSHLFLGPLLVIGALVLTGYAATLAPFIAHNLPLSMIEQTGRLLQIAALALAAIEILAIVVLLGNQKTFGIGKKKPLWERVNR